MKYDKKLYGGMTFNIREDSGDERYAISQQYAWEWSLKITSINEDDSGIYMCKVGHVVIKKFEIIVRVPPRIKEDQSHSQVNLKEGQSVVFSCFATGTPKPNISWFALDPIDKQLKPIHEQSGSYLRIENVTRHTPRNYQCRASNNIPPSDTRNLTFSIEFAPEIEIRTKMDYEQNVMTLNCTITAFPLTNRNFWRKDGNYIDEDSKFAIENLRVDEFTVTSQLRINYYNQYDQGLYECTAENDLRVSKVVYNLQGFIEPVNLIPIGSSIDSKSSSDHTGKHRQPQLQPKNRKFFTKTRISADKFDSDNTASIRKFQFNISST